MSNKPEHFSSENASRFNQRTIINNYKYRLPYSEEIFAKITSLIPYDEKNILDVGTGTGEIAKRMATYVTKVDAIDISENMIREAKKSNLCDNISWIVSKTEDLPLDKNYSLIIAGDSIHWMDWNIIFSLFKKILLKDGFVVLVTREEKTRWDALLKELIRKYSLIKNYQPITLPELLEEQGFWKIKGKYKSEPITHHQLVDNYINSFHSRTSFSIEDMNLTEKEKFDQELRVLVKPFEENNSLDIISISKISWGKPDLFSQ